MCCLTEGEAIVRLLAPLRRLLVRLSSYLQSVVVSRELSLVCHRTSVHGPRERALRTPLRFPTACYPSNARCMQFCVCASFLCKPSPTEPIRDQVARSFCSALNLDRRVRGCIRRWETHHVPLLAPRIKKMIRMSEERT